MSMFRLNNLTVQFSGMTLSPVTANVPPTEMGRAILDFISEQVHWSNVDFYTDDEGNTYMDRDGFRRVSNDSRIADLADAGNNLVYGSRLAVARVLN